MENIDRCYIFQLLNIHLVICPITLLSTQVSSLLFSCRAHTRSCLTIINLSSIQYTISNRNVVDRMAAAFVFCWWQILTFAILQFWAFLLFLSIFWFGLVFTLVHELQGKHQFEETSFVLYLFVFSHFPMASARDKRPFLPQGRRLYKIFERTKS